MKRLLICLFVLFAFLGKAQVFMNVYTGAEFISPNVHVGQQYNNKAIGLAISPQAYFGKHFSFGFTGGFYYAGFENNLTYTTVVPFTADFKYTISNRKVRPVVGLGTGILILSNMVDYRPYHGKYTSTKSYFNLSPVLGVNYSINERFGISAYATLQFIIAKGSPVYYAASAANVGVYFLMKPKTQEAK
jgi:hypothetical protein